MTGDDCGTCSTCFGAGMVSVPSLKALALGSWGTQAVLCHCALGRWMGTRQGGDGPDRTPRSRLMTLEEYSVRNSNWKDMLREHDAECVREMEAKFGKRKMPADMASALNNILERLRDGRVA